MSGKNPESEVERIERELAEARARLDQTLDQIEAKLSPGAILENVLERASDGTSALAHKVGAKLWKHPLAGAVASFGTRYFLGARKKARPGKGKVEKLRRSAREMAHDLREDVVAKAHALQDAVHEHVDDIRDKAKSYTKAAPGKLREGVTHLREDAKGYADGARKRMGVRRRAVEGLIDGSPFATTAIALAIGGLAAALLPATGAERKALAPARKLRRKAKTSISRGVRKLEKAGVDLIDKASQEVGERLQQPLH